MADTSGITLTAVSFSQGKKGLFQMLSNMREQGNGVRRLEQNSGRDIFIIKEKKMEKVSCA